jgi:hypothetical protein
LEDNKESYPDYAQHLSNLMNGMMFLGGFIFTAVTILLTFVPNLTSAHVQLTLLFLTMVFYLAVLSGGTYAVEELYYLEHVPPLTKHIMAQSAMTFLVFVLFGVTFPLLFLLWDLITLTTISGLIWLVIVIYSVFSIWIPYQKWRRNN